MKLLKETYHTLRTKKYSLFLLAFVLFWLKTYSAYLIEFNLGVESLMQHFLLFLNPVSSALFFFAFALMFSGRAQQYALVAINFLMSFLLYANIAYYRFFNDFITVPVLMQAKKNGGQLGGSALALMSPLDILYFADTILLLAIVLMKKVETQPKLAARPLTGLFVAAMLIFSVNLGLANIDRPQLLTRTFDRNYIVKYLGAYNFTIYDIFLNTKSTTQRAMADSNDIAEVENFVKANHARPNPKYFGKAKDMNVIYISLESLQNFVLDYRVDGQEVTPFMNSLKRDPNTFFFENVFHQTGQGKTSDAEFMIANSLFGMPQGSVFINKAQNVYQAAPAILKSEGYTSATFHGNDMSFWNRSEMYKSLGVDRFYDSASYNMTPEATHNYGLKDKPFFEESIPYLKELPQPFYTKFLTLTNHFPFTMDEGDTPFPAEDTNDNVVNYYFQTANYLDQALEQFFNDLKASGLYDNTMIVMYGDHYGISSNHNTAMGEITGEEITPYKNAQLQRVPVFIHIPGVKGEKVDEYGGQLDIRPTMLHLLGVDTKDYISLGTDLLSEQHKELVPFRNGDFVTPEYTQVDSKCYENETGELIDESKCTYYGDKASQMLELSDRIVYGDLLRFYEPEGFEPVNPDDYNYRDMNE
ncbi:LTA synthase family protein [Bacillus marinisedimentorum]|uniref:LTA synthase family protein n=1 Tax=Bacillus marinisedimentorum TaxID=1821260 RepID=UPI000872CAF5|nr:LTA synthase family protein [Bacillus marinisedimentorum]